MAARGRSGVGGGGGWWGGDCCGRCGFLLGEEEGNGVVESGVGGGWRCGGGRLVLWEGSDGIGGGI